MRWLGKISIATAVTKKTPPELAAAMFFLIMLFISVTDLLMEGKYAELMRGKQVAHLAVCFQSFFFFFKSKVNI